MIVCKLCNSEDLNYTSAEAQFHPNLPEHVIVGEGGKCNECGKVFNSLKKTSKEDYYNE